jgi:hypothetical protein
MKTADSLLYDIFGGDHKNKISIISELCEDNSIDYDPEYGSEELNQLIIDNEETIRIMYYERTNDAYGED